MTIVESENIVACDVDDTLVVWDIPEEYRHEAICFDHYGYPTMLLPHKHHIKLLKQFRARGQFVIVWSQGGKGWAAEIVKKLGLEDVVNLVMTKPKWFIDDLPMSAWAKASYINLDGTKKDAVNASGEEFPDDVQSE